jgi:hypothetical protein
MAATPQAVIGVLRKAGIVIQQRGLVSRNERVKRAGAEVVKAPGFRPGTILVQHPDLEILKQCAAALLEAGYVVKAPLSGRILNKGDSLTDEETKSGSFLVAQGKSQEVKAAMNDEERARTVRALRAATNKLSSGLASYLFRDPVDAEELKSLILRFAVTRLTEDPNDESTGSAVHFLLFAYEEAFGKTGWLTGEMASQYARKIYEKQGLDPNNFFMPEALDLEKGLPKWLIEMIAEIQAEDDKALYEFGRKRMAAKAE